MWAWFTNSGTSPGWKRRNTSGKVPMPLPNGRNSPMPASVPAKIDRRESSTRFVSVKRSSTGARPISSASARPITPSTVTSRTERSPPMRRANTSAHSRIPSMPRPTPARERVNTRPSRMAMLADASRAVRFMRNS